MQSHGAHPLITSDIATLKKLVIEQQQMIETLKAQLHRALRREFGPRHEAIDVDQFALFAGAADRSTVIELAVAAAEAAQVAPASPSGTEAAKPRKKALRILKDLPREVRIVDIPEAEKLCGCCGGALHHFADESSEHLAYVPASVKIIETRRKKYACAGCHGEIKRAAVPATVPLQKSMAGASLLAFLIVAKFADGLPLYRIAQRLQRLQRLGIELSHALMSAWLVQCAPLLEDLHARMRRKVLDSGHIFTDDTILPLQNKDPTRRSTIQSRLWVYARHHRRHKPLVTYEFSQSRSQDSPLAILASYRGYVQADAFTGYDRLFANPKIQEVACWAHARRKFVEVAELMKTPGRAHEALAFIRPLYRIERQSRLLTDAERHEQRQRRAVPVLIAFKAWLDTQSNAVLPKSGLGNAVQYALKNWPALTRYTEAGYLEADNNFAERCLRPVAVGRKAFLFVGSERAGRAAAIYYSLIESCKLNKVNPLTYLTYVLEQVRDKSVTLLMPDEFTGNADSIAQI